MFSDVNDLCALVCGHVLCTLCAEVTVLHGVCTACSTPAVRVPVPHIVLDPSLSDVVAEPVDTAELQEALVEAKAESVLRAARLVAAVASTTTCAINAHAMLDELLRRDVELLSKRHRELSLRVTESADAVLKELDVAVDLASVDAGHADANLMLLRRRQFAQVPASVALFIRGAQERCAAPIRSGVFLVGQCMGTVEVFATEGEARLRSLEDTRTAEEAEMRAFAQPVLDDMKRLEYLPAEEFLTALEAHLKGEHGDNPVVQMEVLRYMPMALQPGPRLTPRQKALFVSAVAAAQDIFERGRSFGNAVISFMASLWQTGTSMEGISESVKQLQHCVAKLFLAGYPEAVAALYVPLLIAEGSLPKDLVQEILCEAKRLALTSPSAAVRIAAGRVLARMGD